MSGSIVGYVCSRPAAGEIKPNSSQEKISAFSCCEPVNQEVSRGIRHKSRGIACKYNQLEFNTEVDSKYIYSEDRVDRSEQGITSHREPSAGLSAKEGEQLKERCEILEPFQIYTDILQEVSAEDDCTF